MSCDNNKNMNKKHKILIGIGIEVLATSVKKLQYMQYYAKLTLR